MAPEVALKLYPYRNVLVCFPLFFAVIVRIRAGLNHDYYKEIEPTTTTNTRQQLLSAACVSSLQKLQIN